MEEAARKAREEAELVEAESAAAELAAEEEAAAAADAARSAELAAEAALLKMQQVRRPSPKLRGKGQTIGVSSCHRRFLGLLLLVYARRSWVSRRRGWYAQRERKRLVE